MKAICSFLSAIIGIYSLLIFIRIIFSWFGNMVSGKPVEIIGKITDPYLAWWRNNLNLRIGFLDFSAVAGIVCLSMLQSVFYTLSVSESITIGTILATVLVSLWSIVSFIIGFFIIIIVLRAIAYTTNRNTYSPFWATIDNIYQPLMYKVNRIIFGNKIGNYLHGMIITFFALIILFVAGRFFINFLANIFSGMPI